MRWVQNRIFPALSILNASHCTFIVVMQNFNQRICMLVEIMCQRVSCPINVVVYINYLKKYS